MSQLLSTLFGHATGNSANPAIAANSPRATSRGLNGSDNGDGAGNFSQLLRQAERPTTPAPSTAAAPMPQAAKPAEPAPQKAEQPQAQRSTDGGKTETQRQEARLAARRAAEPASKPQATNKTESPKEAKTEPVQAQDERPEEQDDAVASQSADAANLLPMVALAQQLQARPGGDTDQAKSTADEDGEALSELPGHARPAARAATDPLAGAKAQDKQSRGEDPSDSAQAGADFAAAMAEAGSASHAPAAATRPGAVALEALAAAQATAKHELQEAAPSAAPTEVSLAQPLYEPGFAPELGARLSVLAAEGVQEAQLHLNPAEMGPVAVQIVVDGQQAQISFHAAQAETRAVLEQSLPDLAAALRDSGLTLAGGGVFQQAEGQRQAHGGQGGDGRGERRSAGREADEGLQAVARSAPAPRATRGVVDLYA